jgi:hypothetical protein
LTGRHQLEIKTPGASPEEAAAVVTALEQFLRDTAPPPVEPAVRAPSAWKQAALAEGVALQPRLTR